MALALALAGASPPLGDGAATDSSQASGLQQQSESPSTVPQEQDIEALYASCERGEINRQSDLCAQWNAADSARISATWTRLTGVFTGFGLLVGAVTMGAAIAAALYAKRAADQTKRSANIAQRVVDTDLRPWIDVALSHKSARITDDGALEVHVQITLKNTGRVPALSVEIRMMNCCLDISKNSSVHNAQIMAFLTADPPILSSQVGVLPGDTHHRTVAFTVAKADFRVVEWTPGLKCIMPELVVRADYTWSDGEPRGRTGKSFPISQDLPDVSDSMVVIEPAVKPFILKYRTGDLSKLT